MKKIILVLSSLLITGASEASWRRFTTSGSQASRIEIRGFEAYLSTENIELDKAKEIVSCYDIRDIGEDHYSSLPTLQRSIDLKLVNITSISKDTIKRQYHLELPEINHELDWKNDHHPKDARQTICSIQLEFKQKNLEAKSTYYLDSLPIDNLRAIYSDIFNTEIGGGILLQDDILPCQTMAFTDAEKFNTSDFAEKCSSYYNFYTNTQAKLQHLILRPLSEKGDIGFVPQVNLEQGYLNLAVSDLNNFENYLRKIRLGITTKTVQDFKFERGNKFGTKLGSVIGFFSAADPLIGLAVGGVVGSVFDKSPNAKFESKEVMLPQPTISDAELVKSRLESDFVNHRPMTSYSDFLTYRDLVELYHSLLVIRQPLTKDQISKLNGLKNTYLHKADKLIDLMLKTDYKNQGACVKDGNCDENPHLKAVGLNLPLY